MTPLQGVKLVNKRNESVSSSLEGVGVFHPPSPVDSQTTCPTVPKLSSLPVSLVLRCGVRFKEDNAVKGVGDIRSRKLLLDTQSRC